MDHPSGSALEHSYDAIVIGAGPAGSSVAAELAKEGIDTLILERRQRVGVPVRCAEYIPAGLRFEVDLHPEAVVQQVASMWTFVEMKRVAESRFPGFILNRAVFDQALAGRAVQLGAKLMTDCRVVGIRGIEVSFEHAGRFHSAKGRVIIGADGPLSLTGRSMGLENTAFLHGLQVEVPLMQRMESTQVHFFPELYGGYGWVFPKGQSANVGIGARFSEGAKLSRLLKSFLNELEKAGVIRGDLILKQTGGLIPVGGGLKRTVHENRLLVGDAAGQTDPITGSGIPAAILCGRMAGQAVVGALRKGHPEELGHYEGAWRADIGFSLERAKRRRKALEDGWHRGRFSSLIRNTWIAFREYYHEERSRA